MQVRRVKIKSVIQQCRSHFPSRWTKIAQNKIKRIKHFIIAILVPNVLNFPFILPCDYF